MALQPSFIATICHGMLFFVLVVMAMAPAVIIFMITIEDHSPGKTV